MLVKDLFFQWQSYLSCNYEINKGQLLFNPLVNVQTSKMFELAQMKISLTEIFILLGT